MNLLEPFWGHLNWLGPWHQRDQVNCDLVKTEKKQKKTKKPVNLHPQHISVRTYPSLVNSVFSLDIAKGSDLHEAY